MPTVVGPWQGSSPRARIECDYDVAYNADHTAATPSGNMILASDGSLSDTTNSWEVWGTLGSAAGSNTHYSHGSGGGRTAFCWVSGPAGAGGSDVGGRVRNLEGPGTTIEAVLHLDVGPLAPFTTAYGVMNVTANSFQTTGINADGNGGSLVDIQMQVNTAPQEAGSTQLQAGAWADIYCGGLYRSTLYYFRLRVANNTYGWGPWGPWQGVTTAKGAPSAPQDYYAADISQVSANVPWIGVGDNGGAPITDIYAMINKSPTADGATSFTRGSWGPILFTGLDPGTTYYFRLAVWNGYYWSAWGIWVPFTTLPGVLVKYGGVWRNAIPYVKYGGVWRQAIRYVKQGGVWR